MGFFYAALWLVIGLTLILRLGKEHKVFYVAGGFFLLLGIWRGADSLFPDSGLFSGGWGMALRVVTLIALVIVGAAFFMERNRNIKKEMLAKKAAEKEQVSEADSRKDLEE